MAGSTRRKTSVSLPGLEDMIKVGVLGDDTLMTLGQVIVAAINQRIRLGSGGKTFDNEVIDSNTLAWQEYKTRRNFSPEPLVMTGQMTEPNAWEVSISSGEAKLITLTLASEHHEKWDTIHEIAIEKGLNWDRVWAIGPFEQAAAMKFVSDEIDRVLGG